MSAKEKTGKILKWYKEHTRQFFAKHDPARLKQLDKDEKWLQEALKTLDDDIHICFLGQSGVGKSTLINALIAREDTVLPAGGIGPLTAQALTVRYGETPSFRATYHSSVRLQRLWLALLMTHDPEYFKKNKKDIEVKSRQTVELKPEEFREIYESVTNDDPDKKRRNDEYKKQALLMVAGSQALEQRDVTYLIDGVSEILGKKTVYNTVFKDDDKVRIDHMSKAIKRELPYDCQESDCSDFKAQLHDHAAGFLAPLIKTLEIKWKSEMLKNGLVLVDLPGVGIAGDVRNIKITTEYIREKAKAIVLVVQRGMTEAEATLLRNSGFLSRLLHSLDDPTADPVRLVVAVTRVDDLVNEYSNNDDRPTDEIMADVCSKVEIQVKNQLMNELELMWQDSESLSAGKREVLDRISKSLEAIPVSATEYRKYYRKRNAFITKPEQSNIPRLCENLKSISTAISEQRKVALEKRAALFFSSMTKRLNLFAAEWESDERSREEMEGLKRELEAFLMPIRLEHRNRQGAYRNFLRETLPKEIESLVKDACDDARKKITRYLRGLEDANWRTLRAAVTRGGTFHGARHIQLPYDFAIRFDEPVAEIWGRRILIEIRRKTKEYADDCVKMVEDVVVWSKDKGARMRTPVIEATSAQLKEEAKKVNAVGKEAIDELREIVQQQLIKKIEGPIRRKCEGFVEKNLHNKWGVKSRILDLFNELSDDSVDAAKKPVVELLVGRFREVEKEIMLAFRELDNPIEIIEEKIVSTHEKMVATRDAKLREAALSDIARLTAAKPSIELEL